MNAQSKRIEVHSQLERFESWIRKMFESRQKAEVCYHNLNHTIQIVQNIKEIGAHYPLSEGEQEDLLFAGWLHDVGYWTGPGEGHEERGAVMARQFLTDELGLSQERVERVKALILATKVPQSPQNLLEQIICDADLFHLSSDLFYEQTLLLKREKENSGYGPINLGDWLKGSQAFMLAHKYHTDYAKKFLQPGKERNLELIQMKITEEEQQGDGSKEKKKKKEKKKSERGIETMFRITSTNHLELSALADNKANIMISVNSIIISIVVTVLIRKLEEFPNYVIPTVMLIATCLTAMVFAILATRPKVTHGVVTKEDIQNKKGNLLYFGNFFQMSLPEYKEGMHALMDDGEYLYDSMITDIYYLGKVLSKKYRFLRKSYNIFMFGFVISVLSFVVATIFFDTLPY